MIPLTEDLLFATGGRRKVYFHPQDKGICIKITMQDDLKNRREIAAWYKKFRPLSFFDENRTDFLAYKSISRKGDVIFKHIPKSFGMVKTSLGEGFATELICNQDESQSPILSLQDWIKEHGVSDNLIKAIEDICQFLLDQKLVTRVMNRDNISVRVMEDKSLRVYIIDGFGNSSVLPISNYIDSIAESKIRRQNQKFLRVLKGHYPNQFDDLQLS